MIACSNLAASMASKPVVARRARRAAGFQDCEVLVPVFKKLLVATGGRIHYPKEREYKYRDEEILMSAPYQELFQETSKLSASWNISAACVVKALRGAIDLASSQSLLYSRA